MTKIQNKYPFGTICQRQGTNHALADSGCSLINNPIALVNKNTNSPK